MFHAGAVIPSSVFLLQLLTFPGGDLGRPLDVYDVLDPPVRDGLSAGAGGRASGLNVVEPLPVLAVLGPLLRPNPGDDRPVLEKPPLPLPVVVGLMTPPPRFGPMGVGMLEGFTALATRLNAVMH